LHGQHLRLSCSLIIYPESGFVSKNELLKEVQEIMKYSANKLPGQFGAFGGFNQSVLEDGKVSHKVKELIAVALSLASSCEWCITYHTVEAKKSGLSDDEILEAGFVAVLMAGSPALMHMNILKNALEEK
jgi:AhpD family alkylhydroperoxidase